MAKTATRRRAAPPPEEAPQEEAAAPASQTKAPAKVAEASKLDREALVKALSAAKPALGNIGGIMPAWGHFWFDGKFVYAYDGGLGIRVPFATDLKLGLPGEPLLKLLSTSTLKEVSIEPTENGAQLSMGRARIQLTAMGPEQWMWPFTALEEPDPKWKATLSVSAPLLEGLRKLSFVRAKDPAEAVHYGIAVFPLNNALELYATDSATLASVVIAGAPSPDLADFIAPHPFVKQLLELGRVGDTLHVQSNLTLMGAKGVLVCSNLQEFPDKPDLPAVVAQYDEVKGVPIPSELSLLLKRAEILTGGGETVLTFSAKGPTLRVKGKYAFGNLDEGMDIEEGLEPASANLIAGLVARGLSDADNLAVTKKALVLTGANDFIYIVAAHDA